MNREALETKMAELTILIEEALGDGEQGAAEELYAEQEELAMQLDTL